MRIATWNLEGKWTPAHRSLIESLCADVLLLTEVPAGVAVPGLEIHHTEGEMQPGRRWAAVASRAALRPLPAPHGATALAEVDGIRVASSILPWRSCGAALPWVGSTQGSRTADAVSRISAAHPSVWGGDWNHELTGRLYTGSAEGRTRLHRALADLRLQTPTATAPHRIATATSIDHVAVPEAWSVTAVDRVSAVVDGVALSDHDAYVVDVADVDRHNGASA